MSAQAKKHNAPQGGSRINKGGITRSSDQGRERPPQGATLVKPMGSRFLDQSPRAHQGLTPSRAGEKKSSTNTKELHVGAVKKKNDIERGRA